MKTTKLSQVALLAAIVGSAAFAAQAADEKAPTEKCYGVSKAGENSCAAANGSHSCAGQSKAAYSGQEFKAVPKGSCEQMSGSLKPFDGMNQKVKG